MESEPITPWEKWLWVQKVTLLMYLTYYEEKLDFSSISMSVECGVVCVLWFRDMNILSFMIHYDVLP